MKRNTFKIVLAFGDYLVMCASLFLTLFSRYWPNRFSEALTSHYIPFAIAFLLWIIVFYISELYDVNVIFSHRKFLYAISINIGLTIALFYIFDDFVTITPRRNLALVSFLFIIFFYCWRYIFITIIDMLGIRHKIAILGDDKYSFELAQKIIQKPRQGFRISFICSNAKVEIPTWLHKEKIPVIHHISEVKQAVEEHNVKTIIVSEQWYYSIYDSLYELLPYNIRFYRLTNFWERFEHAIPIYAAKEMWFLENLNHNPGKLYQIIKRIMDIFLALVLLPIFAAPALVISLLLMCTKGNIIFSQKRVGYNNKLFQLYKFRSMYHNAEKNGAQWSTENDSRITPVGRFLRANRLDEIPQLFNILRGDMSFVGPRPERPEFVTILSRTIPHYHLRHLIRPGLTGWAQVNYGYGSNEEDSATKLTYDLYYIRNISIMLDIRVILKTIMTVVSRRGR